MSRMDWEIRIQKYDDKKPGLTQRRGVREQVIDVFDAAGIKKPE